MCSCAPSARLLLPVSPSHQAGHPPLAPQSLRLRVPRASYTFSRPSLASILRPSTSQMPTPERNEATMSTPNCRTLCSGGRYHCLPWLPPRLFYHRPRPFARLARPSLRTPGARSVLSVQTCRCPHTSFSPLRFAHDAPPHAPVARRLYHNTHRGPAAPHTRAFPCFPPFRVT